MLDEMRDWNPVDYLLGATLLADSLREGLSLFGQPYQDFEADSIRTSNTRSFSKIRK